jgi:hypothetical protein
MSEQPDIRHDMPAGWTHLPPPEQSVLLKRDRKGTVRAVEKIPTPLNEFGMPDFDAIHEIALSTLSADYSPPEISNVHHLIYPRVKYHNHPSESLIPRLYRESAWNMVRCHQQLHNYFHEVFLDPEEASMDVMYECARDQSQVDMAFFVGQTAIQLSREKYSEISNDSLLRTHLRFNALQDSRRLQGIFYDLVESYPVSQIGLFPDKDELLEMPFKKAVKTLGVLAGARYMDVRRSSSELVKKIGVA